MVEDRVTSYTQHPFNLGFVKGLNLEIPSPVTFFVGENGTGKSTLLEAIAVLSRFPVSGGSSNDLADDFAPESDSPLAHAMRPVFTKTPRDGYFLRAEFLAHFASLLDERKDDPDFNDDPYKHYGGKSLHQQSHGESFFSVLGNRVKQGLFLFDEPEAALSPQRQLALLMRIEELTRTGQTQFIIATHSPVLMTYPGASIISFDNDRLELVQYEETSHYQVTKGILENPRAYWEHLKRAGD